MNVLDTSFLIDFEKGREPAREFFEAHEHEALTTSTISRFELGFGVAWDGDGDMGTLQESLQWVEFLDFQPEDALEGATIQAELQSTGDRLPIPDVMIAGVARNRGGRVETADSQFDSVRNLEIHCYR